MKSNTFVPTHKTKNGALVISLRGFIEGNVEYRESLFASGGIQNVRADNLTKLPRKLA